MDAQSNTPPTGPRKEVIGRIRPHSPAAESPHARSEGATCRILIVSERSGWVARVRTALGAINTVCDVVRTAHAACAALCIPALDHGDSPADDASFARRDDTRDNRRDPRPSEIARALSYDAVVCDVALPDGDGLALADAARSLQTPVILVAKRASIDLASCAIQHGAADLIERSASSDSDLAARILAIASRFRNHRVARSDGPRRLFRLHQDLPHHKPSHTRQNLPDVSDLLHVPMERAAHMKNVTNVSEFKGLIRGELDIEQLLRTTLEFVLARSGPTNAAVFLPTTSGDYSLGAYVNYDCPKETCDVLLDHLANAVAPRFENIKDDASATPNGMAHLTDDDALAEYLDHDADWLRGSHVVGFPCTHSEECLAVFMLFRDQRSPFQQPLLDQVKVVGDLFAAQLARVIHIHHRHLPKNKWGMIGDPPAETDDYGDMAA
jgi:CheY-like chemotaxis protein